MTPPFDKIYIFTEPGKSQNIKTSRSTEVTLMVLKELQSKSMENVKQEEENLKAADDERKSVHFDGSDSVGKIPSCQSKDKKETESDNLQDVTNAVQTDNIYKELDNSPESKELAAENNISAINDAQQSAEQNPLSEIPNIIHTEEKDSNIMEPDEIEPLASQLESTDNYLKSDPANNVAHTNSALSFLMGSSEGDTEEESGTSKFPTKPPHYAPQSEDTARSSRSDRQENKNAGIKNDKGAKSKNCSVL